MKTCIKTSFPLPMIAAGLASVLVGQAGAQTFRTLRSFNRSDGRYPYGGLVLSSNILYGTASGGSSSGNGTVFALNTDGTGFTNLHLFSDLINGTNSDGAFPYAGLVLSGHWLYGTAASGGSGFGGGGTVFGITTDGTAFATLRSFAAISTNNSVFYTNSDGLFP